MPHRLFITFIMGLALQCALPIGMAAEANVVVHRPLSEILARTTAVDTRIKPPVNIKLPVDTAQPMRSIARVDAQFKATGQRYNAKTGKSQTRFKQVYHGVEVLGGALTVYYAGAPASGASRAGGAPTLSQHPVTARVTGQWIQGIEIDPGELALYQQETALAASMEAAMARFNGNNTRATRSWATEPAHAELVLAEVNNTVVPIHRVSFYAKRASVLRLVSMALDARNPAIVYKVYDNLQHKQFTDTGHGGNNKTTQYTFGEDDVPGLEVEKKGKNCTLRNDTLLVVNSLEKAGSHSYKKAYRYTCGDAVRDQMQYCTKQPWWLSEYNGTFGTIPDAAEDDGVEVANEAWKRWDGIVSALHGIQRSPKGISEKRINELAEPICYTAYSPANDAYYFGQLIYDMYDAWYDTKVLKTPMVLRVHVGTHVKNGEVVERMANAYWDPFRKTMNFGDGDDDEMYPLVSLDIAAHEMSHGFTAAHSDLAYHDQSGALNEAFSDMAGMAAMAYLLEREPLLYQKIYHDTDILWTIGATVTVTPFDGAIGAENVPPAILPLLAELDKLAYSTPIRFMHQPSDDKFSADCFDAVPGCVISYHDVVTNAYEYGAMLASIMCDASEYQECVEMIAQNAIVHEGSGVFNKAFYLLATKPGWSVKRAFELMLTANRDGYWVSPGLAQSQFFNVAACQTLAASQDLGFAVDDVRDAFQQVGLLLESATEVGAQAATPMDTFVCTL